MSSLLVGWTLSNCINKLLICSKYIQTIHTKAGICSAEVTSSHSSSCKAVTSVPLFVILVSRMFLMKWLFPLLNISSSACVTLPFVANVTFCIF